LEYFKQNLGRAMSAKEVSELFGIDIKTVRKYHKELGGLRLGRRYLFFESEVLYAIQEGAKMDSPSEKKWKEETKEVPDEEGGISVGTGYEPANGARPAGGIRYPGPAGDIRYTESSERIEQNPTTTFGGGDPHNVFG
jgi:hypothetical protein